MEFVRRLSKLNPASVPFVIPSCCASTGGKGTTKNFKRTNRRRYRGIKVDDGDYVYPGYLLASQIHKVKYYPGSNVMIGRNMSLTALVQGTVRITREIFVPNPDTELGQMTKSMPIGALIYKPTINIVQDKEVGVFKLKEQI